MVHHPKAGPKQLSGDCYLDAQQPIAINTGTIPGVPGRDMLRFTCRSEGGSAGAPIVAAADGALLGVQVA